MLNYGSITNGATGVITATGNNAIITSGGNHNFTNAGSFLKTNPTGTTAFTINATNTGTIQGVGTISSSFTNNGNIAPGNPTGILTVNGAQPFSGTSTLQIQLQDGSGAGTGHDQLARSSNLTLSGTLTVTQTGTVPNGTYTIINLTSGFISGSFSAINLPADYTLQVNPTNVVVIKEASCINPRPTIGIDVNITFCQGQSVTLT